MGRVRDYLIQEYTKTVCPHCFASGPLPSDTPDIFKDGQLVTRDNKVWMRRHCAVHGTTESLYEEDASIWEARRGWSTPTQEMVPDRPGNAGGFPDGYRHGLPAGHGQHTCILLLNVTERCNYSCPACYASAAAPGTATTRPERPTLAEIRHTVETVIAREGGSLGVVMISGGEPTVRDDLPEVVEALVEYPITRVMLNTNGRRIVRDERFVALLERHRAKLEVYLQYDGGGAAASLALRGEDVEAEKRETLRRLDQAGVFTTLVMTVARGVNDHAVGEVMALGLATPHCSGMAIQPMFGSGRNPGFDPQDRVTPTGVLARLGEQTGGLVGAQDFIPLPCSHRDCCDLTYMIKLADGSWRSLPALIGREELKKWIGAVANTITFDNLSAPIISMLQSGALNRVLSEQQRVGAPALAFDLAKMACCVPELPAALGSLWQRLGQGRDTNRAEALARRTFRVTTKMFMDAHTFHESRLRQCCVHTGTFEEDPRRYSFCWRWLFSDAPDFPPEPAIPLSAIRNARS